MTATQKIKQALTGSPVGEPVYQHEGSNVVRWITGGVLPDVRATFHHKGSIIEARCSVCGDVLGEISANYDVDTSDVLAAMRREFPLKHQHL